MEFSAIQIAELLEGSVEGNGEVKVSNLAKIEEGTPGTLTFLANPKYEAFIYSTAASIAIVNRDFQPEKDLPATLTVIRVEDAHKSFIRLLEVYQQAKDNKSGIQPGAFISDSAVVPESAYVGPGVYIGNRAKIGEHVILEQGIYIGDDVTIGDQTKIHPGVKIMERCQIGSHCEFHPNVVIGGDGFGFAPNSENFYKKVPQIGNVIIDDHVEIGANTSIDRATLGSTIIRKGVKLDNLIQIAHNVEIGENTVIAAQTGIAGSTKIGKNCLFGGQVGIVGHITIADGVKIAAQSGIGSSIKEEGAVVQGSPAIPIIDFKKSYVGFTKLPEMLKDIRELKKQSNSK